MQDHHLLIDLSINAGSPAAIDAVLFERFGVNNWLDLMACAEARLLPVGGDKRALPPHNEDQWNNNHACNAVRDPVQALYEKVTNGYDSVTERWVNNNLLQGKLSGLTPALVQQQMAGDLDAINGGVFFFASRFEDSQNAVVVDSGLGIEADQLAQTIMSIGRSNKMKKPWLAGSYGFGGSAIYQFAERTLIISVSHKNPNVAVFTVVAKIHRRGDKAPCYAYLVDVNGDPFTADLTQIPSALVLNFEDGADLWKRVQNGAHPEKKLFLPKAGGTIVKVVDYQWPNAFFTSKMQMWYRLNVLGFGNPIPLHFFHEKAKGGFDRMRIYGVRKRLSEQSTSYNIMFHQPAHSILGGKATIEAAVVDWARNDFGEPLGWETKAETRARINATKAGKKPPAPRATPATEPLYPKSHDIDPSAPITGLIPRNAWVSPIYVTVNGQTHATLPIKVILKNAGRDGLERLNGCMIIEVALDDMPVEERSRFLTSTREDLTDHGKEVIREAVLNYLSSDVAYPDLRAISEKLMKIDTRGRQSIETPKDRLKKFLSSVASVCSKFGAPSKEGESDGKNTDKPVKKLFDPATEMVGVNKVMVEQGKETYFTVNSNATQAARDEFSIDVSGAPFLSYVSTTGLNNNGKVGFLVSCDEKAALDTTGTVEVTLDRSRHNLPPLTTKWEVTVVAPRVRKPREPGEKAKPKNELPDVSVRLVTSDQMTATSYEYMKIGEGQYEARVNVDFGPLKDMLSNLSGEKKDNFETRLDLSMKGAIIMELDAEADDPILSDLDAEADNRRKDVMLKTILLGLVSDLDIKVERRKTRKQKIAEMRLDEGDDFIIDFETANDDGDEDTDEAATG